MAIRTGTPFNSHSANLKPGLYESLLSNLTETPFALSAFEIVFALSESVSNCSSVL